MSSVSSPSVPTTTNSIGHSPRRAPCHDAVRRTDTIDLEGLSRPGGERLEHSASDFFAKALRPALIGDLARTGGVPEHLDSRPAA